MRSDSGAKKLADWLQPWHGAWLHSKRGDPGVLEIVGKNRRRKQRVQWMHEELVFKTMEKSHDALKLCDTDFGCSVSYFKTYMIILMKWNFLTFGFTKSFGNFVENGKQASIVGFLIMLWTKSIGHFFFVAWFKCQIFLYFRHFCLIIRNAQMPLFEIRKEPLLEIGHTQVLDCGQLGGGIEKAVSKKAHQAREHAEATFPGRQNNP